MTKERLTVATDWDGTITDQFALLEDFGLLAIEHLVAEYGLGTSEITDLMASSVVEVRQNPKDHAWIIDGRVVGYSTDHLRVVQMAANLLLKRLGYSSSEAASMSEKMYFACAPRLVTIFRSDAQKVVSELARRGDLVIITNSSTSKVDKELASLMGEETRIRVIGGARKFIIDPNFSQLPEYGEANYGFPNKVSLQQRFYYDVLINVFGSLSEARMMGDNGLLDLVLVDFGGGKTGLVHSELAMPWEVAYWSQGGERKAGSLQEVAEWIVE